MLLKRLSNARSIDHIFLDLVILRDEFRHQFQDVIEQVARDSNDAFERVTENNIALLFISVISNGNWIKGLELTLPTTLISRIPAGSSTYRRDSDSSEKDGDVAGSGLRGRAGTDGGCCAGVDLVLLRYILVHDLLYYR